MKASILLLSLLLAAAGAHADMLDKIGNRKPNPNLVEAGPWQEQPQPLPAYLPAPHWLPLEMPVTVRPRVFIASDDLQLGEDKVIRYTLRQQSASGIDNISREGLHCDQRQFRSYAFGDNAGQRWIESRQGKWQALRADDLLRRGVLEALCPQGWTPQSATELAANLTRAAKR